MAKPNNDPIKVRPEFRDHWRDAVRQVVEQYEADYNRKNKKPDRYAASAASASHMPQFDPSLVGVEADIRFKPVKRTPDPRYEYESHETVDDEGTKGREFNPRGSVTVTPEEAKDIVLSVMLPRDISVDKLAASMSREYRKNITADMLTVEDVQPDKARIRFSDEREFRPAKRISISMDKVLAAPAAEMDKAPPVGFATRVAGSGAENKLG